MLRQALASSSSTRRPMSPLAPWHAARLRSRVPAAGGVRARLASSQTPHGRPDASSNEPIVLDEPTPSTDSPKEDPSSSDPSSHPHPHTTSTEVPHPGPSQQSAAYSTASAFESVDKLEELKERLRAWTTPAAAQLRQRIDGLSHHAARTFSHLGGELNRVTGYEEIDALKKQVVRQEEQIKAARQHAHEAKEAHDTAVRDRAASQREVNDLLQRKSSWTDADVGRFTTLVREDHLREQAEARAKEAAYAAEAGVEREFDELMRVILNRYHEEQAWSDKIRSASTYGSILVLGVNTLVFVLAIMLVEPWKRRRLAQTFERKVDELAEHTTTVVHDRTEALAERLQEQEKVMTRLLETIYFTTQPATAASIDMVAGAEAPRAGAATAEMPGQEDASQALNRQVAIAIASSAAVASFLGWLAGSWFG